MSQVIYTERRGTRIDQALPLVDRIASAEVQRQNDGESLSHQMPELPEKFVAKVVAELEIQVKHGFWDQARRTIDKAAADWAAIRREPELLAEDETC